MMKRNAKTGQFARQRFNILLCGAKGSGKSSLFNALISPYASEVRSGSEGRIEAKEDGLSIDSQWELQSSTQETLITAFEAPVLDEIDNKARYLDFTELIIRIL